MIKAVLEKCEDSTLKHLLIVHELRQLLSVEFRLILLLLHHCALHLLNLLVKGLGHGNGFTDELVASSFEAFNERFFLKSFQLVRQEQKLALVFL